MGERYEKAQEMRIIASEPILAEILAKHKPILISQVGWNWIVEWIASIGSIVRSRDYIAFNLAYLVSMAGVSKAAEILKRLGIKLRV